MEPRRSGKGSEFPAADRTDARRETMVPSAGMPRPSHVSAPAMREVVKGWWTSTERLIPAAELERSDLEKATREHR
jgi:hypothetical protein